MTDITETRRQYPREVDTEHESEFERQVMAAAERQSAQLEPSDTEYVANSIDRCRYLDVKAIAKGILGDKQVTTPAELADLMAEWAAANKTKVPA